MSDFDRKMAERIREVFENYRQEADSAAMASIRGRLKSGHGAVSTGAVTDFGAADAEAFNTALPDVIAADSAAAIAPDSSAATSNAAPGHTGLRAAGSGAGGVSPQVSTADSTPSASSGKISRLFWMRVAAAAVLLLAVGSSIWLYTMGGGVQEIVSSELTMSDAPLIVPADSTSISSSQVDDSSYMSDDFVAEGSVAASSRSRIQNGNTAVKAPGDVRSSDPGTQIASTSDYAALVSIKAEAAFADSATQSEDVRPIVLPIAALQTGDTAESASETRSVERADSVSHQSSTELPIAALQTGDTAESASETRTVERADSVSHQSSTELPIAALRTGREPEIASGTINPEIQPVPNQNRDASRTELIAGSILSWSDEQLASGLGFTAGALQNWPVSRGLRISAGAQLSYNRFGVDSNTNLQTQLARFDELGNNFNTEFVNRVSYDLLAVEIPFNLTVDLSRQQSGTIALTTGISSLWYIRQSFSDEFVQVSGQIRTNANTGNPESVVQAATRKQTEVTEPFSRFDAAGLFNISLGFTPEASRWPVSFDVYIKYPLANLTDREITYGMGGLTLRYRLR